MNHKWLKLAGELLDSAADRMSNAGCNDWQWPADWSESEKLEFATRMVADNVRGSRLILTEADLQEARELASGMFGPPDWWVARFLADKLMQ